MILVATQSARQPLANLARQAMTARLYRQDALPAPSLTRLPPNAPLLLLQMEKTDDMMSMYIQADMDRDLGDKSHEELQLDLMAAERERDLMQQLRSAEAEAARYKDLAEAERQPLLAAKTGLGKFASSPRPSSLQNGAETRAFGSEQKTTMSRGRGTTREANIW